MNQTKNILFLVLAFMIVGLATVFFTHQTVQSNNGISQENYIEHIKPWIDSIYIDQSLVNISNTKNNFLNFKGSDQSIGPAHIALFLAFDSWEQFLMSGDINKKQQSIDHLYSAADLLPGISLEIKNLENILSQQNV